MGNSPKFAGSTSNIDVDDINDVNICDFMPDDNEPNNEREDVAGIFKTLQNILLTLMQLSIIIFIVVHIYGILAWLRKQTALLHHVLLLKPATFYDPHRQYFPKSPIYAGKSSSDELKSYDNQLPGDSVMHNNISDLKKQISELLGELADIKAFMNDTANWRSSIEKKLTVSVTSSNRSADFSVEDKIRNALKLYDADKLGIAGTKQGLIQILFFSHASNSYWADYALESSGGSVVSTPETIPYPSNIVYELFGFIPLKSISNPNFAIQPYNSPGQCFAFYGSKGKIRIHLAKRISITNFTIEHVNSNLVDDISSAPKEMIVYVRNKK